ncbi:MAG: hypothetical protein HN436_05485, partial [Oceanospirillaceae bacterium]|nr:hypothetical protein [Oceanospirillaceae bacterium]
QIMVAHPFNPVYLLPLVELVPSPANNPEIIQQAQSLLTGLGMKPLHRLALRSTMVLGLSGGCRLGKQQRQLAMGCRMRHRCLTLFQSIQPYYPRRKV